jgi:Zn-dependent peptidase ImmA (M78 family)
LAELPIDPIAIAERHGISVQAKPPDVEGVSGMLLRHGDEFMIVYATDIRGAGFQRFSIAHELGHYFLDGHCDQLLTHGLHTSRAGQGSDPYEREADAFASGLLMPRSLLAPMIRSRDTGLDLLLELAGTFVTSLTATGLRLVEIAREPAAVIISNAGTIEIVGMSESFKPIARRGWLKRGDGIPTGSISSALASNAARIRAGGRLDGRVDLADWYDCERTTMGREEAIGLGAHGRVLTFLTCPNAEEEEVEDREEEDLVESWTPRFRR